MTAQPNEPLHTSPFDAIRRIAEDGSEYWSARDLAKVLGYKTNFRNFKLAIGRAEISCKNSGHNPADHFAGVRKMVKIGSGAEREVEDVYLTRYACYLIVQNADPNKEIVALGQTYFVEQARRQELAAQWAALPEAKKRLALRGEMSVHNTNLSAAARQAGVVEPRDFAVFQDHGYQGLYGGLKASDIREHKGLNKKQEILDYMGSDELAANIFRASQTKQKLERDNIKVKTAANQAHQEVGHKVRKAIVDIGGTMPEELPTPTESIQELERKEVKRLKQGPQISMFGDE